MLLVSDPPPPPPPVSCADSTTERTGATMPVLCGKLAILKPPSAILLLAGLRLDADTMWRHESIMCVHVSSHRPHDKPMQDLFANTN